MEKKVEFYKRVKIILKSYLSVDEKKGRFLVNGYILWVIRVRFRWSVFSRGRWG